MDTSIVINTLSDGSKTYDVVFVDGSQKVIIAAADERGATRIQTALADDASYAQVDPAA